MSGSGQHKKQLSKVRQAATLRMAGKTWPQVAQIMKVGQSSARRWEKQYADVWQEAAVKAQKTVLTRIVQIGMEAVEDMRALRDSLKKRRDHESKRLQQACDHSLSATMCKMLPSQSFVTTTEGGKTYEETMAEIQTAAGRIGQEREGQEEKA